MDRINRIKPEIKLSFQIDQKYEDILILIKNNLGGIIGYRWIHNTYFYSSTSFSSAKKSYKLF